MNHARKDYGYVSLSFPSYTRDCELGLPKEGFLFTILDSHVLQSFIKTLAFSI